MGLAIGPGTAMAIEGPEPQPAISRQLSFKGTLYGVFPQGRFRMQTAWEWTGEADGMGEYGSEIC